MSVKITVASLESTEDRFIFEAPTLALAVAQCVTVLADGVWRFEYAEDFATLLKTLGEAIGNESGKAKEWDFSSPDDAYTIEIEEIDDTFGQETAEKLELRSVDPDKVRAAIAPYQTISFVDPTGKNGLLDVDPADCRFDVSAVQCEGDRWRLTAEVHNMKDGGEDGWYIFFEGYQHNRILNVPRGSWSEGNGWIFASAADALATAQIWCKELGVQSADTDALSLHDNPAPVPTAKKIKAVTQRIMHGDCSVNATFEDGETVYLFSYYIDELSFDDSEFIGLTQKEAMALRHKKDVAYLQS